MANRELRLFYLWLLNDWFCEENIHMWMLWKIKNLTCVVQFQEKKKTDNSSNNNNNKTTKKRVAISHRHYYNLSLSYTLRIVYVLGSVHTNVFSKVHVSVVIENASIDLRPRYCFDTFTTFQINAICMRFRFDQFSRAFLNRCAFDENTQRISVDGRP